MTTDRAWRRPSAGQRSSSAEQLSTIWSRLSLQTDTVIHPTPAPARLHPSPHGVHMSRPLPPPSERQLRRLAPLMPKLIDMLDELDLPDRKTPLAPGFSGPRLRLVND